MKTIWKIYDNDKKKILNEKSYRTREEAEEGRQKITRVRMASRESYDLNVIEAGHIVNHDDIYNLQCDLDRLEHFKLENDTEKVQEYFELIALHVKEALKEEWTLEMIVLS